MSATPSPSSKVDGPALIAAILCVLARTIGDRLRLGVVTQAQVVCIVGRLMGIRRQFPRVVARVRAGKIPRERVRKARKRPVWDSALMRLEPPRGWRKYKAKWARIEREIAGLVPPPLQALCQTQGWLLRLAPRIPGFRDSAASCRLFAINSASADPRRCFAMAAVG